MVLLHVKGEPASSDLLLLMPELFIVTKNIIALNYLPSKNCKQELNFKKKLIPLLPPETKTQRILLKLLCFVFQQVFKNTQEHYFFLYDTATKESCLVCA